MVGRRQLLLVLVAQRRDLRAVDAPQEARVEGLVHDDVGVDVLRELADGLDAVGHGLRGEQRLLLQMPQILHRARAHVAFAEAADERVRRRLVVVRAAEANLRLCRVHDGEQPLPARLESLIGVTHESTQLLVLVQHQLLVVDDHRRRRRSRSRRRRSVQSRRLNGDGDASEEVANELD